MKKLFLFLAVSIIFMGLTGTVSADTPCTTNAQCTVPGSTCQLWSVTPTNSVAGCFCTSGGSNPTPCPLTVNLVNPLCLTGSSVNGAPCITDFPGLLDKIMAFLVGLIASLATIVIVWAGILFVTSGGDPGKVGTAKKAFIWAAVGIAVSLAGAGLIAVIKAVIVQPPTT